jgi:hypothetical protein
VEASHPSHPNVSIDHRIDALPALFLLFHQCMMLVHMGAAALEFLPQSSSF